MLHTTFAISVGFVRVTQGPFHPLGSDGLPLEGFVDWGNHTVSLGPGQAPFLGGRQGIHHWLNVTRYYRLSSGLVVGLTVKLKIRLPEVLFLGGGDH